MRRMLSTVGGIALALVVSQFPEYAQQYTQRLGGAVDELRVLTAEFDTAATEAGLSRTEALERYAATPDAFVAGRGLSMQATFVRYETLSATLAEIRGASGWERFTLLPRYLDSDIGRRTLEHYQSAVPVTMEGFAYAFGGFVLGYGALYALLSLVLLPFRRRTYVERQEPRGL